MSAARPTYDSCNAYLSSLATLSPSEWQFKQEPLFMQFMEHVSKEQGTDYIRCIEKRFPQVSFDLIRAYVQINDRYGGSNKRIFPFNCAESQSTKLLYCSATSLRYVWQALMTLDYAHTKHCTHVVELGPGYGGMFLAMQFLTPLFGDEITHVTMIETEKGADLLTAYLKAHQDAIQMTYQVVASETLMSTPWFNDFSSSDVAVSAFAAKHLFVSHYCFTELDVQEQERVRQLVIDVCDHGLITWQTCFGDDPTQAGNKIEKAIERMEEEEPSTGPEHAKNYYVYF